MARFEDAIGTVLAHEGGFVDNPADPGGRTNFGITQGYYDGLAAHGKVEPLDVKDLTIDQAKAIYQQFWWNAFQYEAINDQTVATKVFDEAVNVGSRRMHKFTQQACNVLGQNLIVDGNLGPKSFEAINACDPQALVTQLRSELATYYTNLANAKPELKIFLRNWLRRAAS